MIRYETHTIPNRIISDAKQKTRRITFSKENRVTPRMASTLIVITSRLYHEKQWSGLVHASIAMIPIFWEWRCSTWTEHVLVCWSGFVRLDHLVGWFRGSETLSMVRVPTRQTLFWCADSGVNFHDFGSCSVDVATLLLGVCLGWHWFKFTEGILHCFGSLDLAKLTQKVYLDMVPGVSLCWLLRMSLLRCLYRFSNLFSRLLGSVQRLFDWLSVHPYLFNVHRRVVSNFEQNAQVWSMYRQGSSLKKKTELQTSRKGGRVLVTSLLTQHVQEAPLHHWNLNTLRSNTFPWCLIGYCTGHREPTETKSCRVVLSPFPCRVASVCLFSWSWGTSIFSFLCAQRCLVEYLVLLSCLTQKQSFDSSSPVFRSLCGLPPLVFQIQNIHTFINALYHMAPVLITWKRTKRLHKKDAEVVECALRSTSQFSER